MTNCNQHQQPSPVEKTSGEKLFDLCERKPENYDVSFCIGPDKKIVQGLKVILKAASSFLEREFEEKWETVIENKQEIVLHDFEPEAFQLFIKLTILDTWSPEDLERLYLPPDHVLSLISICRRFQVRTAQRNLEELAKVFFQSFHRFKDTDEFLRISQSNLENVLASDELGMEEMEVFKCACRWAEYQCTTRGLEVTGGAIRHVLGPSLYEIRFPLMSTTEFTKVTKLKHLLTPEETLQLYTFMGMEDAEKLSSDSNSLPFKTYKREPAAQRSLSLQSNLNSKENFGFDSYLPEGCSTVRLTKCASVDDASPFACSGEWFTENRMYTNQSVELYALGFFGPLDGDTFYDITVEIAKRKNSEDTCSSGKLEKRVFAKKGQTFHFVFDEPIPVSALADDMWGDYHDVRFSLKGPSTSQRSEWSVPTMEKDGTTFRFLWGSKQLAEILFKKPTQEKSPPPAYDKTMADNYSNYKKDLF